MRDGVASLRTEKSRFNTEVTIPILPVLQTTLDSGPCGELAFICGDRGTPLTKESFGNMFRVACTAAGVSKSAHGVRKIGATRAANAGATSGGTGSPFRLAGRALWRHFTRAQLTGAGSRKEQSTS